MGIVQRVFPSEDGRVRKIELRVVNNGRVVTYVRLVTETVLLFVPYESLRCLTSQAGSVPLHGLFCVFIRF